MGRKCLAFRVQRGRPDSIAVAAIGASASWMPWARACCSMRATAAAPMASERGRIRNWSWRSDCWIWRASTVWANQAQISRSSTSVNDYRRVILPDRVRVITFARRLPVQVERDRSAYPILTQRCGPGAERNGGELYLIAVTFCKTADSDYGCSPVTRARLCWRSSHWPWASAAIQRFSVLSTPPCGGLCLYPIPSDWSGFGPIAQGAISPTLLQDIAAMPSGRWAALGSNPGFQP